MPYLLLVITNMTNSDANNLNDSASQIRQQQQKLQNLLAEIEVTGKSKNQKVTVIITGEQKIVDIIIDPSLVELAYEVIQKLEHDKQQKALNKILSKPIIEGVDDAITKVQSEVVKSIQETGSLGDLMSMLQAASNT